MRNNTPHPDSMKALALLIAGCPVRGVSQHYGISARTLRRYREAQSRHVAAAGGLEAFNSLYFDPCDHEAVLLRSRGGQTVWNTTAQRGHRGYLTRPSSRGRL